MMARGLEGSSSDGVVTHQSGSSGQALARVLSAQEQAKPGLSEAMQELELYKDRKAFRADVSSHEHVEGEGEVSFGGYPVRIYTPSMIVYEKLRALCQQMEGCPPVSHPGARPRGFVDITSTLEGREVVVFGDRAVLAKMFAAKDHPLDFLNRSSSLCGPTPIVHRRATSGCKDCAGRQG